MMMCGHGPDDILQAHGRLHVRTRVHCLSVLSGVNDRDEVMIDVEVVVGPSIMSATTVEKRRYS